MRARRLLALALLLATACGAREYEGRGVVRDVHLDDGQVVIEHEEIPGLMEAMTMSFDVPDRALLERLREDMLIDFTLRRAGHSFQVIDFEPVRAGVSGSGAPLPTLAEVRDPAPDFDLVDQDGRPYRGALPRTRARAAGTARRPAEATLSAPRVEKVPYRTSPALLGRRADYALACLRPGPLSELRLIAYA